MSDKDRFFGAFGGSGSGSGGSALTLYNGDGSLPENRNVALAGYSLIFSGGTVGIRDTLSVQCTDATESFIGSFLNTSTEYTLAIKNITNNVGIGTGTPESDAKLEIKSDSQGLLIPRMSTTGRSGISLSAANKSLLIYNNTTNQFEYIDSSLNWAALGGGDSIYTADDSLTDNRIVDLNSKTLTFTQTGNFDGLIVDYTSSGLTNYQRASLKLLSEANGGIFEVTGKQGSVLIEGNNTFTKKDHSGNTDFLIASNGGGYWKGATVTIGENTFGKTEILQGGVIQITDITGVGVQHFIPRGASNQIAYFYGQGYVNTAGILFGSTAKVGTEQFLSKGRTAIQGLDTLGTSTAFEIYDGDTTPSKLWDFSNDGNLIGSGKRITNTIVNPTVQETTSTATFTINADEQNTGVLTAQAAALTVANPTGTSVQGQKLVYRIKDDGTARAITWGADFRVIGVTLPTTTTANKLIYVGCIYNTTDSKWDVIAVNEEA